MDSKIIIQGALANSKSQIPTMDFLDYMKTNIPEALCYKLTPPHGRVMAAAFDWTIVVGTVSGIITIAGALWKA